MAQHLPQLKKARRALGRQLSDPSTQAEISSRSPASPAMPKRESQPISPEQQESDAAALGDLLEEVEGLVNVNRLKAQAGNLLGDPGDPHSLQSRISSGRLLSNFGAPPPKPPQSWVEASPIDFPKSDPPDDQRVDHEGRVIEFCSGDSDGSEERGGS